MTVNTCHCECLCPRKPGVTYYSMITGKDDSTARCHWCRSGKHFKRKTPKPTLKNKHEWSAVCDEKGNQVEDLMHCDLCGKTVHMSEVVGDISSGNLRREKK